MFVLGRPFQGSLIFVGEGMSLPKSEAKVIHSGRLRTYLQNNTPHNDNQHQYQIMIMLIVSLFIVMLSAIILTVVVVSVVAPSEATLFYF